MQELRGGFRRKEYTSSWETVAGLVESENRPRSVLQARFWESNQSNSARKRGFWLFRGPLPILSTLDDLERITSNNHCDTV